MNTQTQHSNGQADTNNAPDWVVKTPKGYVRKAKLERVGVAWNREKDGGICLRLTGTQVISEDIYLFPVPAGETTPSEV